MIQANELRIGNFVNDDIEKLICEVKQICNETIWLFTDEDYPVEQNTTTDYYEQDFSKVSPITLTEEWLLKVGGKRFAKDFVLHGVIIHKRKRGFIINKSIPIIEHLHQLQNFIFANRGKELKIKL